MAKKDDKKKVHYPQNPDCKCVMCQFNRNRDVALKFASDIDTTNGRLKDIETYCDRNNSIMEMHNKALDGLKDIVKDLKSKHETLGRRCDAQFKGTKNGFNALEDKIDQAAFDARADVKDIKGGMKDIRGKIDEVKKKHDDLSTIVYQDREDTRKWRQGILKKLLDTIYKKGKIIKKREGVNL